MKYLEKYVFQFIPDIFKMEDLPLSTDDNLLCDYFGLNELEKEEVMKFNTKPYKTFVKYKVI